MDGVEIFTCVDGDRVDPSPRDRRVLMEAFSFDAAQATTSPAKEEREQSPTQRKRGKTDGYIRGSLITCIYNLNSYLISLIFMLILCNYDACYLNFMNFLQWNGILLKFIFMHKLGIIICLIDD